MKYPKIHSLWKREGRDMKGALIPGEYSVKEFGNIKRWQVQEKIDGCNVRVVYKHIPVISSDRGGLLNSIPDIKFEGRNDDSQMPPHLLKYLQETFIHEKMDALFPNIGGDMVRLFGEGYGPKIQNGSYYRKDVSFCLFDIFVNGWWLEQSAVERIASELGIPYAPIIGIMTEEEIVEYVKSNPLSLCSITPQVIEGVICRPEQLLLLRNREPLMFKLKCKEFKD
jgi:ATP-dependent RNA circularization protein (DNA/RNA ligase family)